MSGSIEVYELAQKQWDSPDGVAALIEHFETSEGKHEAELLIGELAAQVPESKKGKRVTDLGCGNGRLIPYVQEFARYDGFDTSDLMLARARMAFGDMPNVNFYRLDILEGAPAPTAPDLLLSIDTSRHYHDPLGLLRLIVSEWPAKYYLFSILHGKATELINGQVVDTALMEAALPELGTEVDRRKQDISPEMTVTYVLLKAKAK